MYKRCRAPRYRVPLAHSVPGTSNRKRLRPNAMSEWELRIEKYRIFYDLNHEEQLVEVRVVGEKKGNRVLVRGEEYKL